jgi:hypothetical protein
MTEFMDLGEFDPSTIDPESKIFVVGQSGSGKTAIMQDILYHMRNKLEICLAFCPSRDSNLEYRRHLPKSLVYDNWSLDHLDRITKTQLMLAKLPKRRDGSTRNRRFGIIIDDCLYDKKQFMGPSMKYLLMNGRHEKFFTMICAQYVVDLPKDLRSQINLAIVFPEAQEGLREAMRINLLGIFKDDEQLQAAFKVLERYEALVFDIKAYRERRPCMFVYKARYPLPHFLVGDARVWLKHYKYSVKEDNSKLMDFIRQKVEEARTGTGGGGLLDSNKKRGASGACAVKPSLVIRRSEAADPAGAGTGAGAGVGGGGKRGGPPPMLRKVAIPSRLMNEPSPRRDRDRDRRARVH